MRRKFVFCEDGILSKCFKVLELLKDATTYPHLEIANNLVINKEIMYKKGRIHRLRNASLAFRSALSVDCVLNSPDVTVLEGFDAFEIAVKNGTLGGVSSLLWVPLPYEGTNDKN